MLTALRTQVQQTLAALPVSRRPVLRRCDAPHALLATNLPFIADDATVRAFSAQMTDQGWCVTPENGWLLLDAPVPVPDAVIPKAPAGEVGCCISLLLRHPDAGDAAKSIRAVAKAAEAGRQPLDRLCTQLHADFAARLRQHEPLPGALLPYLCCAYYMYHG